MVYIIVNTVMYMSEEKILILLLLYIHKISDVHTFLTKCKTDCFKCKFIKTLNIYLKQIKHHQTKNKIMKICTMEVWVQCAYH